MTCLNDTSAEEENGCPQLAGTSLYSFQTFNNSKLSFKCVTVLTYQKLHGKQCV